MNFDLGGWGVRIRNQRLRELQSNEFRPNQITFGILIRHISSGSPFSPRGAYCFTSPTMYKIYNKVAERLPKTAKTFI